MLQSCGQRLIMARPVRRGRSARNFRNFATFIWKALPPGRAMTSPPHRGPRAQESRELRIPVQSKELYEKGKLGKIQHLTASHPQDMDSWPSYWEEMIPMHNATHVVSPCLGLMDSLAESVSYFGSGTVRDAIAKKSGNKFAVESCHIKLKDSDVTAHIWRFLYDVARQYRESFDVYGTKKSFEWTLIENEPHVIHTAKKPDPEIPEKVEVPDYAHLLPEGIRRFTLPAEIHDAEHLCLCARRRPRRFASAHGPRNGQRLAGRPRSMADRQLDLRRSVRSPVCGQVGGARSLTGVHALLAAMNLIPRIK